MYENPITDTKPYTLHNTTTTWAAKLSKSLCHLGSLQHHGILDQYLHSIGTDVTAIIAPTKCNIRTK